MSLSFFIPLPRRWTNLAKSPDLFSRSTGPHGPAPPDFAQLQPQIYCPPRFGSLTPYQVSLPSDLNPGSRGGPARLSVTDESE